MQTKTSRYAPVDVTNDCHWCGDMDDVGLAHEHLLRLLADLPQERFMQKLFLQQPLYTRV